MHYNTYNIMIIYYRINSIGTEYILKINKSDNNLVLFLFQNSYYYCSITYT